MIPVVTAIVAGVLAGAIALYRERRIELAALLVAARVMSTSLKTVGGFVQAASTGELEPELLGDAPGVESAFATWERHRDVLASNLRFDQWEVVEDAIWGVSLVLAVRESTEDSLPTLLREHSDEMMRSALILSHYAHRAGRLSNPGRKAPVPGAEMFAGDSG